MKIQNSIPTTATGKQYSILALPKKVKQAVSDFGIWMYFMLQGRLSMSLTFHSEAGCPVNFYFSEITLISVYAVSKKRIRKESSQLNGSREQKVEWMSLTEENCFRLRTKGQMDQASLSPGSASYQMGPSPDLSTSFFIHECNDNIYSQDCRVQRGECP